MALPSTISQNCGAGEPLMYSILIPIKLLFRLNVVKKLFTINILGGCICGAILGILGTKMYMFGIFNYVNPAGYMGDAVNHCISGRHRHHGSHHCRVQ